MNKFSGLLMTALLFTGSVIALATSAEDKYDALSNDALLAFDHHTSATQNVSDPALGRPEPIEHAARNLPVELTPYYHEKKAVLISDYNLQDPRKAAIY